MNDRERIVSYLRQHPQSPTPEIGKALFSNYQYPTSNCYRYLAAMERDGLVMREKKMGHGRITCVWTLTEGRE